MNKNIDHMKVGFEMQDDPYVKVRLGLEIADTIFKNGDFVGENSFRKNESLNNSLKQYEIYNQIFSEIMKTEPQNFSSDNAFDFEKKALNYAILSQNHSIVTLAKNYINTINYFSEDYKEALNYFYKSLDICFKNNYTDILLHLYINISNFPIVTGNHEIAIEYYKKGLVVAK